MNLSWDAENVPGRTGRETVVKIRAVNEEIRSSIIETITEAVAEGESVAKAKVPHGRGGGRGHVRLSNAIKAGPVRYHPGGAGGGGFYEASLEVDASIAPQARWVMEGTGEYADLPFGRIYPARGNVMVIMKQGESPSFVRWSRGQRPNTLWWEDANRRMEDSVARGIRNI
jgi:hypothetical protein